MASLLPRYFVEFVHAEEVSDWTQDRPGVDYGPRWPGDPGIRVRQQEQREKLAEMLADAGTSIDPELEKLLPKFPTEEPAKKPRKKHKYRPKK